MATHYCFPCLNCKVICAICFHCSCKYELYQLDINKKEENMYRLKNTCCDNFEKLTNPEEWIVIHRSERKIVIQNEYYSNKNISYIVTVFAEETNGFKDIIRLRELISKRINKLAEDVKIASIADLVSRVLE